MVDLFPLFRVHFFVVLFCFSMLRPTGAGAGAAAVADAVRVLGDINFYDIIQNINFLDRQKFVAAENILLFLRMNSHFTSSRI